MKVQERGVSRWLLAAWLLVWSCTGGAATLKDLRFVSVGGTLRADLLLDGAVKHRVFTLEDPLRVVIDIEQTHAPRTPRMVVNTGPVTGVRSARQGDGLRVVLDLSEKVEVRTSLKPPGKGRYHHLVVELGPVGTSDGTRTDLKLDLPGSRNKGFSTHSTPKSPPQLPPKSSTIAKVRMQTREKTAPAAPARIPTQSAVRSTSRTAPTPKSLSDPLPAPGPRDFVVAVDAGHGGKDPGAKGRRGTLEKQVVLSIARQLKKDIDRVPGLRAVLIRSSDRYVGLRGRMRRARNNGADMFVSVHADAFKKASASGASVFVLSRKGATSESARWLAKQENAPFLAGGVMLVDKDGDLRHAILDMSQTASLEAGFGVAEQVLARLGKVTKLHSGHVERAGFLVLKSPDIPSILVETGFLSNPGEERKLRTRKHQRKIARAIRDGVLAYFSAHPPAGTLLAERKHTIKRGDTLSAIALRYSVSLRHLRRINGIDGNHLRVGQVIRIPSSSYIARSDG